MSSNMSKREALDSLRGTVCPRCSLWKEPRQSLCKKCYFALPDHYRRSLYKKIGSGYSKAINQSIDWLKSKASA